MSDQESAEQQPLLPISYDSPTSRPGVLSVWQENVARVLESRRLHTFVLILVRYCIRLRFTSSPDTTLTRLSLMQSASLQRSDTAYLPMDAVQKSQQSQNGWNSWETYPLLLPLSFLLKYLSRCGRLGLNFTCLSMASPTLLYISLMPLLSSQHLSWNLS